MMFHPWRCLMGASICFSILIIFFLSTVLVNIPMHIPQKLETTKICTPRHNVAFLKTHKCASSAIQNMLFRYGLNNNLTFALPSFGNYFGRSGMSFNAAMVNASPWNRPDVNIYAIHTKWQMQEIQKIMSNDTIYITIVREPTELFESLYSYVDMEKGSGMTLEQYVDTVPVDGQRYMNYIGYNQMTYDFGLPNDQFNQETLEKFLPLWDKQFDLVMVAERMEESLILLKDILCLNISDVVLLKLNSRKSQFKIPLSLKTRFKLQKRLKLDYILYDHFITRFSKKLKEYGIDKMKQEVSVLREVVHSMSERCDLQEKDFKNLTGPYKPYSNKVSGYETNATDSACRNLVRSELSFISYLLNKQKIKRGGQVNMHGFPLGALSAGQNNIEDIVKILKESDLIQTHKRVNLK